MEFDLHCMAPKRQEGEVRTPSQAYSLNTVECSALKKKKKAKRWGWGYSSEVKSLPCVCDVWMVGLILDTTNKKGSGIKSTGVKVLTWPAANPQNCI